MVPPYGLADRTGTLSACVAILPIRFVIEAASWERWRTLDNGRGRESTEWLRPPLVVGWRDELAVAVHEHRQRRSRSSGEMVG